MEAQRFPEDFDGIIAGDPGYKRTDGGFQVMAAAQAVHNNPASFIPGSKYPAMHKAVLNKCDAIDGLTDGIIDDPRRCSFDPGVLACKAGDAPDCLTAPQVEAARRIYAPVMDPKTGAEVFPGFEPGSELGWATASGETPHPMYHDLFRFVVFQDRLWDFRTLDMSATLEKARALDRSIPLSPTSANIKPFVSRGGKLVIYHGWADPSISPRASIQYYDQLVQTIGKPEVDRSVRLYMVPGMGHCGGGNAPNEFDMIAVLDAWRADGQAPAGVVASQVVDGQVVRTRPLCPYPQVARYKGTGAVEKAENFACRMP
jgi:feruloyl esterase